MKDNGGLFRYNLNSDNMSDTVSRISEESPFSSSYRSGSTFQPGSNSRTSITRHSSLMTRVNHQIIKI